ncbi:Sec23-binding domain of Sec16-domain-containing protein [Radiomyces spectabilis]|uniref:Sec23-binding domain of Sec16-domain-containing protein n=1 Tax=Radiomyces spectabilis TaxID=64574 RepID=UPI00221EE0A4|nr:Sec23-binding domain of Sec16-domain-containing protein [Radiomyces spectabilis]KAI8379686.1 Sec23-binding domain of Sec16-domain-containing protein [Radiomyces spectabilis]
MQQQYEYDPNQWQQFDPNVHYYYDEQGLLHYYDPNTNQEYDMTEYAPYGPTTQGYSPHYGEHTTAPERQPTPSLAPPPVERVMTPITQRLASPQPEMLYPCPDQLCEGENKAKAKFCCECGRPLGSFSRSSTPATALSPPPAAPYRVSNDMYSAADVSAAPPDPLQRGKGCPLVSFGFGGKLCVMFPQTVQRFTNTSYEQRAPITKRMPSVIQIKSLKSVLGDQHTALSSLSEFVGPVLMDSKMNVKSKKKEVIAYMHKRIEEFNVTLSTLAEGSHEHTHMKNKMLLWKLVQTLIENEGHIGDGSAMDNAIRGLLQLPAVTEDEQNTFSVPAYAQELPSTENDDDRSTFILDKLQRLLLNGDRDGAVEYAMQEDLWAHALILSSCINKDLWKTVVTGFIERELAVTPEVKQSRVYQHVLGDKQSLRVLYSLFAGSGAAAVSELTRNQPLQRPNTPYGAATAAPVIDPDQLSHWTETLGLILANRTARDAEAITAIGDLLKTAGWIEAAHFCYLLSPQTSVHSGIDAVNVRLTLIGAQGPHAYTQLDALYLTELYEFALATKQSSPVPLPFLQGYKFAHALWLADMGCVGEAQRYCEAIANGIKTYTKGSPYLHQHLVEKLKEFAQLCEMASGNSFGFVSSIFYFAKYLIEEPENLTIGFCLSLFFSALMRVDG